MISKYKYGEVWLATFVFDDDESKYKARPVLVLGDYAVSLCGFKMTTRKPRDEHEYEVKYWKEAGLSKPTTIRTSKYIPLTDEIMIRKIGSLQPYDLLNFRKKLKEYTEALKD